MKIAVACINEEVAEHFGHCEKFQVFTVSDGKIITVENLKNPEHQPGVLPGFLKRNGIDVIMSGGMGGGAIDLFNALEIETVTGVKGLAQEAVKQYLLGNLKSSGSVCHQHQHHADCGH